MKMRIHTKSVLFGVAAVILSVTVTTVAVLVLMRGELTRQAQEFQNIKMRTLHELVQRKGGAKVADGKLMFGDYVANENYEIVDKLKQLGGGTATIFQGDIRVATNVLKDDGTRAIGTPLVGAAKEATIDRGQPYRGAADILGIPYFTAYDPIADEHGRTIGVLYVGVKQDEFFRSFRQLTLVAVGAAAGLAAVFGLAVSVLTGRLMKRLSVLTRSAESVSMGEALDVPLEVDSEDEVGELTHAIDRLRVSMREALKRLAA